MAFTRPEDRATQGCDPSAARGFAKEWHLSMLLFFATPLQNQCVKPRGVGLAPHEPDALWNLTAFPICSQNVTETDQIM